MERQKTYVAKPGEVAQNWYIVDAEDKVLGRLARDIAVVLMGKHRPTYTPHVDTGEFVIVVNCEKIGLSGNKMSQKSYNWFTGYTGHQIESVGRRLERYPDRVIREAVRRMLPKSKLGRHMLEKLKIYAGPEHPHQAQQPQPLKVSVKRPNKKAAAAS